MKRFFLIFTMVLLSCTLLFAQPVNERPTTEEHAATEEASFPVTITDMAGRNVTIETKPERIVSGYYISSSALIAMDADDKLVGIETKSNARPIYKAAAPEIMDLADVGSAKAFALETCLATNPDLVIFPIKQKANADVIQDMGIPTIVVNPESHEEILYMFEILGKATGNEEKAGRLISYYRSLLEDIEALTNDVENRPVVYMGGTSSYLTTAPKDMYQASLIESAGGRNAGDTIEGSSWKEISYEQLISMNPDFIVIPTNNFATGNPGYTRDDILSDGNLSEITAVKEGRVYQMPIGLEAWDSPVPSGILGVLWMTATIHPELFSMDDFRATATAFYEEFYGFTPSF